MFKYSKGVYRLVESRWKGATLTVNWIDENVCVGDIADVQLREGLREMGVEFILDVRIHFHAAGIDDMAPLPSVWKFANDILELSEKGKVMIHCHGGIDRSPFVGMLYYKLKHGCSFEEAYDHIAKVRPQCLVHDSWVRLVQTF